MDAETNYNQDSQFIGVYHAIPAIGGFNIEPIEAIPTITNIETAELDLTLALQLKVNVSTFNEKIGLMKDTNNNEILQTSFDSYDNSFSIQDISFNYQDLMPDIILDNVISVGGFSSIYRNFKRDIINYYEHANNVPLFNSSSRVVAEGREFTKKDFVDIFTNINYDGGYDISGQIHIYQISAILNNLYTNDPFHNRTNKIYEDGFIEGDLISLSSGLSIRLNLSEMSTPHNNVNHTANNSSPPILLSKIYTVPLVLHLKNL
jgi:hypothetical protein